MADDRAGSGPELAKTSSVMREGLETSRWGRAIEATAARSMPRERAGILLAQLVVWSTICVTLWILRYPAWRIWVLAVMGVLPVAVSPGGFRGIRGLSPWDVRMGFLAVSTAAAVTGGIRSPFLVAVLAPVIQVTIRRGIAKPTKRYVVGFFALLLVLALLPSAWVGPPPPNPAYGVIVLLVLCFAGAMLMDYFSLFAQTFEANLDQVFRARDEVATQALARARELEMLSSKLSHELKNPLGAVKALAQLCARTAADQATRERLEVVEAEVERIEAILEGYLDFSRPVETLRAESVALGDLIDEALASLEGRAEVAGVDLIRRGDERFVGDSRRLKEAFLNLIANAIEATPPRGRVTVEISKREDTVLVRVRDTGTGMAPEVLARVGSPFFTTRERGTGLGVLLARSTVAQHGGTLEYTSAPGEGTVATCTLPAVQQGRVGDGARIAGG
jgi:signal transduction histidine kinase